MTAPHLIDVQVGAAVRRERRAAGWSQERLAVAIGVSFQQLQKYERGANRISASKLFEISKALSVHIAILFGEKAEPPELPPVDAHLAEQLQSISAQGRRALIAVLRAFESADG